MQHSTDGGEAPSYLQYPEGTPPVLVEALQGQSTPQLDEASE